MATTYRKYHENLNLPAVVIENNDEILIIATKETTQILGYSPRGSGKTHKEAESQFFECIKAMNTYYQHKTTELDKKAIFDKGNWQKIGGKWFQILGIHFFFRYGKNMKGGFYLPFTYLNIKIDNLWRKNKSNGTNN